MVRGLIRALWPKRLPKGRRPGNVLYRIIDGLLGRLVLAKLIASALGLAPSAVRLSAGAAGRTKALLIDDAEVRRRLGAP